MAAPARGPPARRARANGAGSHQFQRPMREMSAGTSRVRTMTASRSIPTARAEATILTSWLAVLAADGTGALDEIASVSAEAYVKAQQAPSSPAAPGFALPSSLTAREVEILRLIAAGLTNGEIAERLFISPLTCKSHVSRILTKLEARDRIQLVVLAYESRLIIPGQAGGPPGPPPSSPP